MRNRAKCRLCTDIIESFHPTDTVECSCSEIMVHGGAAMKCAAIDWNNFMRVDNEGNEIIVTVKDSNIPETPDSSDVKPLDIENEEKILTYRQKALEAIKTMRESLEKLPQNAMTAPITHYDLLSVLLLLEALALD